MVINDASKTTPRLLNVLCQSLHVGLLAMSIKLGYFYGIDLKRWASCIDH